MQYQYVINREQMYQLDKRTMTEYPIESPILMEVAGLKSSQKLTEKFPTKNHTYLILCSHGNNSGDGFVIARWLINASANVEILFVGDESKMTSETHKNYLLCKKLGCLFIDNESFDLSSLLPDTVVIDALLGIGFQGQLRLPISLIIEQVNKLQNPRVAIDIPSGLDADTGESNLAFKADFTYTMAAIKQGMLLNKGPACCGKIEIIDIGIPEMYYKELDFSAKIQTQMKYPQRYKHSHKGDYGKVLIIAGSSGYSGAAILSAKACVKAGAGLVKLLHPQGMESIFESSLTEVMTTGITCETNLDEYLEWSDVLLIGPGLGQSKEAEHILVYVLKYYLKTLVIDADGINLIAKNRQILLRSKARILLTPHLGEFSRLSGISIPQLKQNLLKYTRNFIKEYPVSLLLKNANTLYIDPKCSRFNITGNDGLSTGGSGDVLAGIIVSFLGQKMTLADAAINASYYLGKLVEKMSQSQSTFSIIPSEIIEHIGKITIE